MESADGKGFRLAELRQAYDEEKKTTQPAPKPKKKKKHRAKGAVTTAIVPTAGYSRSVAELGAAPGPHDVKRGNVVLEVEWQTEPRTKGVTAFDPRFTVLWSLDRAHHPSAQHSTTMQTKVLLNTLRATPSTVLRFALFGDSKSQSKPRYATTSKIGMGQVRLGDLVATHTNPARFVLVAVHADDMDCELNLQVRLRVVESDDQRWVQHLLQQHWPSMGTPGTPLKESPIYSVDALRRSEEKIFWGDAGAAGSGVPRGHQRRIVYGPLGETGGFSQIPVWFLVQLFAHEDPQDPTDEDVLLRLFTFARWLLRKTDVPTLSTEFVAQMLGAWLWSFVYRPDRHYKSPHACFDQFYTGRMVVPGPNRSRAADCEDTSAEAHLVFNALLARKIWSPRLTFLRDLAEWCRTQQLRLYTVDVVIRGQGNQASGLHFAVELWNPTTGEVVPLDTVSRTVCAPAACKALHARSHGFDDRRSVRRYFSMESIKREFYLQTICRYTSSADEAHRGIIAYSGSGDGGNYPGKPVVVAPKGDPLGRWALLERYRDALPLVPGLTGCDELFHGRMADVLALLPRSDTREDRDDAEPVFWEGSAVPRAWPLWLSTDPPAERCLCWYPGEGSWGPMPHTAAAVNAAVDGEPFRLQPSKSGGALYAGPWLYWPLSVDQGFWLALVAMPSVATGAK